MRVNIIVALFALVIAAGLSGWAFAQRDRGPRVEPRPVVEAVAAQIGTTFYDRERGAAIAADLRQMNESGRFDALTNPYDLASELTRILVPHDRHFRVDWWSNETPAAVDAGWQAENRQRVNYGFASAEMLPGAVAVLDVRRFESVVDEPGSRRAADAAMAFIADADAIILDFRNHGGGARTMTDYFLRNFLPEGIDAYAGTQLRDGRIEHMRVVTPAFPRHDDVPIFVLVSGRTISAGEAVPYALQRAHRAIVVGERTVGAANAGSVYALTSGFTMFVAWGRTISPLTNSNWEGVGVQPDIETPAEGALNHAYALALEAVAQRRPSANAAAENAWVLDSLRANAPALTRQHAARYLGTYGQRRIEFEDGALVVRRESWPPQTLRQLDDDLFFVEGEPLVRLRFERGLTGRVNALLLQLPNGAQVRSRRAS